MHLKIILLLSLIVTVAGLKATKGKKAKKAKGKSNVNNQCLSRNQLETRVANIKDVYAPDPNANVYSYCQANIIGTLTADNIVGVNTRFSSTGDYQSPTISWVKGSLGVAGLELTIYFYLEGNTAEGGTRQGEEHSFSLIGVWNFEFNEIVFVNAESNAGYGQTITCRPTSTDGYGGDLTSLFCSMIETSSPPANDSDNYIGLSYTMYLVKGENSCPCVYKIADFVDH
ncbi:hypothetical protein TrLO_g15695 [Triparma laevis f. longispina]|uniref:Uncharacterized protein n=1 Tax=Triparma laevis f. longispina TaxID=1714387 RepID=A0A9W7FIK9_9STRA|nr:hypothetical protein TrLO_g15695 [Triparma laevis f. longispina]